ncbi:MAG: hypothetical protein ACUZ8O_01935 [Candidatus Anammoxibacter sp.]
MYLRNFKIYLISLALLFSFSNRVFAHEFIQPEAGDVLTANSDFTLIWEVPEDEFDPASNFDIRFSRDNGSNWDIVVTNLDSSLREFEWKVPNINTNQGMLEIIEDRDNGDDDGGRSDVFTIVKTKAFTFNCEDVFKKWLFGLEILTMDIGNEQSCVLKLTHIEPDVAVEISTKPRAVGRSSIEVFPTSGITDENGELEFTLTAMNEGIGWISWSVPDTNGKVRFNKKAYDIGNAWGMIVNVR